MKRIGIIGTGTMGAGIAQIAGQKRCEVIIQNRKQKSLDLGLQLIQKSLERLVSRDKITRHQADGVMERIHPTIALEELKGCDIVIESAPEDFDVKVEILRKLDGIVGEDCIIATNTSSLSVTRLASAVSEVVTGMRTTDSTVIAVRDFAEFLGKLPIDVKDYPGFVVNRVLFPMINEAAFALQEGVATAKGIDDCMKAGCNHPMGPLAVADLVGLDVVHAILTSLYVEYGNPRYAPCLEITKRVEAGWLGQKTGRGFYDYGK